MAPAAFMEDFVPRALGALGFRVETPISLGVRIEGPGGGTWQLRFCGEAVAVASGADDDAVLAVVQGIDDWRGALWEGRGGFFGRQASALLQGAAAAPFGGGGVFASEEAAAPPDFGAFAPLASLDGVVAVVVAEPAGSPLADWQVRFELGGAAPGSEATTQVRVEAADAAAMERGELDPLEAFMTGRMQVTGDMTLLLQLQAVVMQALRPPPG